MKKTYKLNKNEFDNLVMESVKKTIRKMLSEDVFDDMYGEFGDSEEDEVDSYANDLISKYEKESGSIGDLSKNNDENIIDQSSEDEDEDDDSIEGVSIGGEYETDADQNAQDNDGVYEDALDAIESSDGNVTFEEWFSGLEDVDANVAKTAFERAQNEYSEKDTYTVDSAPSFHERLQDVEPEHRSGNVIDYDGVEITDDGTQYTMIANTDNPKITIKGSKLNDVKNTYNSLWSDLGRMEDKARKMGMTEFYGALLWGDDYDNYVRSAGAHDPNYPIIIDLDKLAQRNKGVKSRSETSSDTSGDDWIEAYKHGNGKYMMTDYQASRLSPEQRSRWEELKKTNPGTYGGYSEVPSEKKANRYKKQ